MGCLAVIDVLKEKYDHEFYLKYPNDVYANDNGTPKKICGVLVENSYFGSKATQTIIGIGLNCNQEEFPQELIQKATSLKKIGIDFTIEDLSNSIIERLEYYLDLNDIYSIWPNKLRIIGKDIQIIGQKGLWQVTEIFPDGRLVAKNDIQQKIIDNGDSIIYSLDDE
jgi:biotin-(acetyl-CoA carboxylase) ligase